MARKNIFGNCSYSCSYAYTNIYICVQVWKEKGNCKISEYDEQKKLWLQIIERGKGKKESKCAHEWKHTHTQIDRKEGGKERERKRERDRYIERKMKKNHYFILAIGFKTIKVRVVIMVYD